VLAVHFSDPRWLWLLALLPVLLLFEWLAARRGERALKQLAGASPALLARRRPGRRRLSALLRLLALAALALGAAGPEWGREVVRRAAYGSDVVLAIDCSASMDVRDVPPSRLEEAKREANAVVDRLEGSRIGLVVFAGDAIRICPLTLDRSAVRLLLETVSSASVSEPGTDLGRALRVAARALPEGRHREQLVVIWTDGEDLEQGASAAIRDLSQRGTRVFAVGVGTPAGDVVPVLDEQGRAVDVKRDEQGGPVRSRLDELLLRTLARRTGGAYFSASRPGGELPRLLGALGQVERGERGERLVERPVPRFPLFAGAAVLLLSWEWLWPRRRAAVLVLALLLGLAPGARAQGLWERGNRAYRAGRFVEAESLYRERLRHGAAPGAQVNLGAAAARLGRDDEAERAWREAGRRPGSAGQSALYDLGTWLGEKRRDDEALAELREALRRDPRDADARHNYEVLLRRSEEERKRQGGQRERPQPGSPGGSPSSQGPQAGQAPRQGQAPTPAPTSAPPPLQGLQQQPGRPAGLTREQADWLQTITEQAEREQRRAARQVRVVRERRGRDW
jgi:Ca-activated chloride channel family protein